MKNSDKYLLIEQMLDHGTLNGRLGVSTKLHNEIKKAVMVASKSRANPDTIRSETIDTYYELYG